MLHCHMLFLLVTTAFATPVNVTVVDATTGKTIQYASVHCDDSLTTKRITDAKGRSTLDCNTGSNTIQVFHEEYGKKAIPLTIENANGNTVRIRLESPLPSLKMSNKQPPSLGTSSPVRNSNAFLVLGDLVRALQSLPGVARPNIAEGAIVVGGQRASTPSLM